MKSVENVNCPNKIETTVTETDCRLHFSDTENVENTLQPPCPPPTDQSQPTIWSNTLESDQSEPIDQPQPAGWSNTLEPIHHHQHYQQPHSPESSNDSSNEQATISNGEIYYATDHVTEMLEDAFDPHSLLKCSTAEFEATINHLFCL